MSSEEWPWSELGLVEATEDRKEIKRAYARKLKTIDQSVDLESFANLRGAYEYALMLAGQQKQNHATFSQLGYREETEPKPDSGNDVVLVFEEKETAKETSAGVIDVSKINGGAGVPSIEVLIEDAVASDGDGLDDIKPEAPKADSQELPKEIQDDWDYLLGLSHRIYDLVHQKKGAFELQPWRDILDDEALISFSARRYIEEQVFRALIEATKYDEERSAPYVPPEVTPEFVKLIDDHFGWFSDGVAFNRNYGEAGLWLTRAFTSPELRFERDRDQYRQPVSVEEDKAFFSWWWMLLVVYFGYRYLAAG